MKGLSVGVTYRNDKQAQIFTHYIANAQRNQLLKKYEAANFISVISDGTTDSSVTEAEIVYIRFATAGVINVHFVAVKNVDTGRAPSIKAAIDEVMKAQFGDSWTRKLIGFGADGAAVMQGKKGGVVSLYKNELNKPYLQAIHCSAHKLELAFKDSSKDIKLFQKVNELLLNIYLFYKNSPLNRSLLKTSFKASGLNTKIPTRVGGTRWLPHLNRALENLLTSLKPVIQHLEQVFNRCLFHRFIKFSI